MGTWNATINGNDTASDLKSEYTAVFYKYDVDEALDRIDKYVRNEMFDETDEEEWCNYYYSLADFMWKKGILTEGVRDKAIEMIDSGFGLEIWEAEGQKTLNLRKKKLQEFREKLVSEMPPRKKIKPNTYTERVFEDGDIVAVQLQTEGKIFTEKRHRDISDEEFQSCHGKYVLMQLVKCVSSWSSSIVPEVKDYWAYFRLFDGIYDEIPENICPDNLKEAAIKQGYGISSAFSCESSLFYFKKRKYKVICNRKDLLHNVDMNSNNSIYWQHNTPDNNPDSLLVAAIGKRLLCSEFFGDMERVHNICRLANRYGRFIYRLSGEENEARFAVEEARIAECIKNAVAGGKIYCISFGGMRGIVTVDGGCVDNLYIEGQYQNNGFGTKLLEYAFEVAGDDAYIKVPQKHAVLNHICLKLGLTGAELPDGNVVYRRQINISSK